MFGKRGGSAEAVSQRWVEPVVAPPPVAAASAQKAAPASKAQSSSTSPAAAATSAKGAAPPPRVEAAARTPLPSAPVPLAVDNRSDDYYQVKTMIFSALIDTIDLGQLAQLDAEFRARGNPRHRQRNHLHQERW